MTAHPNTFPQLLVVLLFSFGLPGGTVVKSLATNAGEANDVGSMPGSGRSPGVGNGKPLQYSCQENSRGAWWATVHGVTKGRTQLSMHACTCCSVTKSYPTLWDPMDCSQAPLSTLSQSLLKFMPTESVMLYYYLILSFPLPLPSIFPSIRVFSNELAICIRWPKYWSFSVSISPSNEYSGLISFRIDWFDLLAVQGTLKSLNGFPFPSPKIFPAQRLNPCFLHWHSSLLSHQGSPYDF